jgi:hypothetical protein
MNYVINQGKKSRLIAHVHANKVSSRLQLGYCLYWGTAKWNHTEVTNLSSSFFYFIYCILHPFN